MFESKLIDGKGPVGPLKRLEHLVKWFAFGLLRLLLKRGTALKTPLRLEELHKIILLRPDTKLGDMILSLPLVELLKRAAPDVELHLLCSPQCAIVARHDPRFTSVHLYCKRLFSDIATVAALRKESFAAVVDLQLDDSVTALLLSQWCSKSALRLGAGKAHFASYYDFVVNLSKMADQHCIDTTLALSEPFGIAREAESGFAGPFLTERQIAFADEFAEDAKAGSGCSTLIGLNLSAGSSTRIWPTLRLKELLDGLLTALPTAMVVLICSPADRPRAQELFAMCNRRVLLIPDRLGFLDAAAIVRRLDLLVSPDTSLVHVARSFEVPVVAMYPAHRGNLARYYPYGQPDGVVVSGNVQDIQDIAIPDVLEKIKQVTSKLKRQEAE